MSEEMNVSLSSPWEIYRKRVYNIFTKDPEVDVSDGRDEENGVYAFTIYSANTVKLDAIKKILKNDIPLGNITIHIDFEDTSDGEPTASDFIAAFDGNPLFAEISDREYPGGEIVEFMVFNREIITYFNDDLTDYCGNGHEIAADIVRDIVKDSVDVYICTKTDAADEELEEEDEDEDDDYSICDE